MHRREQFEAELALLMGKYGLPHVIVMTRTNTNVEIWGLALEHYPPDHPDHILATILPDFIKKWMLEHRDEINDTVERMRGDT